MGDPASLIGFVQWAKTNYSAPHCALVIRDHGDGLGGMEENDRSHDYLTIPELDQFLDSITSSGANALDLLFMPGRAGCERTASASLPTGAGGPLLAAD